MENSTKPKSEAEESAIKVLFEWEAAERIWEPKSRIWFLAYAAAFSLVILVAAKLGYFILILGMLALLFLLFVHATVPPLITKNKITNAGIISRDILFKWENLSGFWFGVKGNYWQIHLDLKSSEDREIPRVSVLFNAEDDAKIFNLIAKHISYSNTTEADYNFLSELLYGKYIPVNKYIEDLDQPEAEQRPQSDVVDDQPTESAPESV